MIQKVLKTMSHMQYTLSEVSKINIKSIPNHGVGEKYYLKINLEFLSGE